MEQPSMQQLAQPQPSQPQPSQPQPLQERKRARALEDECGREAEDGDLNESPVEEKFDKKPLQDADGPSETKDHAEAPKAVKVIKNEEKPEVQPDDFDFDFDWHAPLECRAWNGYVCSHCVRYMRGSSGIWIGRDQDADIWLNDGND